MADILLKVKSRSVGGRGSLGRLRRNGFLPGVVYGREATEPLSISAREFAKVWKTAGRSSIVTMVAEDNSKTSVLIQDVQRDPVTDQFLHVDFHRVASDEKMTAHIPVHVKGEAYGVKTEGGVLDIPSHQVEVRCLPGDLPHQIDVDVSEMRAGEIIHVRDLPALAGVEYLNDPDQPVVSVVAARGPKDDKEAEEAVTEEPAAAS